MLPILLSFFLTVLALVGVSVWRRAEGDRRPVPGPRRKPLIGNILDFPKEKEWLTLTKWRKTYGDIVSLSVFGQNFVILNSVKAVVDLLDKRSLHYSDRASLPMGCELIGYDHFLVLAPYGARFRQMRRLFHQVMSPRAAQAYWPVQELETARFLNRLLETPDNFTQHIRHTAGAIILKISHGYTASETQDKLIDIAEKVLDEFAVAVRPGAFLVDLIPWLKYMPSWFPGAGFKRIAAEWRKDLFDMADLAHEFTKNEVNQERALPSFTSGHLEKSITPEDELLVKWTAVSMYAGGADTTVSSMTTFFLAMCMHPEVQVTAQAELDSVVGEDQLPKVEDRSSLPYIEAIFKEVLRWGPVASGVPHRLTKDDEYEGYKFSKGSIMWANIWGMLHDPDIFPEPSEFRPDRFMGPGKVDGPQGNPLNLAFGFGRRVCPGQNLAESSMFLGIAMTLATFTISKARDDSGNFIEPELEWTSGGISHPKPFRCEIKPRSSRAVGLIKQTVG